MKILVVGTGGPDDISLVGKVLDKLHHDFIVTEVIRGADENSDSIDAQVDRWCREEGVPQNICEVLWRNNTKNMNVWSDSVFRRNVRMLAMAPDLVVVFDGAEGASPFLDLRIVRVPIICVGQAGEMHTLGRGWGEFLRARFREAVTIKKESA